MFKLLFKLKFLGFVEAPVGVFFYFLFIFALINVRFTTFWQTPNRKSQDGTQVQILDLEFSLETHFPSTHPGKSS